MRDNCVNGNIKGAMKHIRGAYKLCYTINNLTKPYVAFLNGIVMGGGVGISLSGKYRVATEKTLFAMPEAAIGYYADFGGSYLISRLKDYIGIYLVLTGNRLKGKDVRRVGAATHYTNSSNLSKIENELFKVNELTNESVYSIFDSSKIKEIFSLDSIEKIYESLENDKTEWSKKQLELLNKMSPSSLKVIIRQMSLGKSMSFRDCLIMEKNLSYNFLGKHDFKEGVKTLLVQKDRNPQWKPATFKEIDQDIVNSYFKETNSYSLDI